MVVWDLTQRKLLSKFEHHSGAITCMDFHPHEVLLAVGSNTLSGFLTPLGSADKTTKFFDLETFQLISSTEPAVSKVRTVSFTPDGLLAIIGYQEGVKLSSWEPAETQGQANANWGNLMDICVYKDQLFGCATGGTYVSVWVGNLQVTF